MGGAGGVEGLEGLASLFSGLGDIGDGGAPAGGSVGTKKRRRSECPKGRTRVPKDLDSILSRPRRNQFIANGCGPEGMQVEEPFGLWQCCNGHDVCYSTCGASFQLCEDQFGRCMKGVCDRIQSPERARECHKQASSFTGMTGIFGKGSHASSQRDTCECKKKGPEADAAWRSFVEAVYAKSGATGGMGQDTAAINAMLPHGHEPINDARTDGGAIDALMKAWKGKEGELAFDMVRRYGVYFVKATGSTPLAFIGRDQESVYKPKESL